MENSDPPGTHRNAAGRLCDEKGHFVKDPNKISVATRRSRGNRSVSASTPRQGDRSRSFEQGPGQEDRLQGNSVNENLLLPPHSTLPDPADNMEVARRRIAKKRDTLEDVPKAAEKHRERMQAQLRQGIPIRVDHVPEVLSTPEVISPLRVPIEGVPLSSEVPTSPQPLTGYEPNRTGVQKYQIHSHPTTPRVAEEDDLQYQDLEDAWDSVCCQCGDIMQQDDVVCCCRCDHRCHRLRHHICGEDMVRVHCKRDHFASGQPFRTPMTHGDLLRNIRLGVTVTSGSKIQNLEQSRLTVLEELGTALPGEPKTSAASVAVALPGTATQQTDVALPGTSVGRPQSLGKRTAKVFGKPPGLEEVESQSKEDPGDICHGHSSACGSASESCTTF
eukprot:5195622-Amphidinium_carterae.2